MSKKNYKFNALFDFMHINMDIEVDAYSPEEAQEKILEKIDEIEKGLNKVGKVKDSDFILHGVDIISADSYNNEEEDNYEQK